MQQPWMNGGNIWQAGNENNCIDRCFEQYNDSSKPTLINLPLQQNQYQYASANLLREVQLISKNLQKWEILDSGASSHFILSTSPVLNKKIAYKPLTVKYPDGRTVCSSHKSTLPLTKLPMEARIAHIILGLASHSLISVVKFLRLRMQSRDERIFVWDQVQQNCYHKM